MNSFKLPAYIKLIPLAVIYLAMLITGCKKTELDQPAPIDIKKDVSFLKERNILVFKSITALQQRIEKNLADTSGLISGTGLEFPGFLSMKQVYDSFNIVETALVKNIPDSVKNGTNVDVRNFLRLSDIGKNYKKTILIRQFPNNSEYYYDMNIGNRELADLVNPDGLVVVNDSIYQFSENYVKIITDGDYSKLHILDNITATNEADHIFVISSAKWIPVWPPFHTTSAGCETIWDRSGEKYTLFRRLSFKVHFVQYAEGSYTRTSCVINKELLKERSGIAFGWGLWFDADKVVRYISLQGAFSAPHTPYLKSGGLGYKIPSPSNPFDIYYSSPVEHFTDYSPLSTPCYTMTHGNYQMTANFIIGGGITATVAW